MICSAFSDVAIFAFLSGVVGPVLTSGGIRPLLRGSAVDCTGPDGHLSSGWVFCSLAFFEGVFAVGRTGPDGHLSFGWVFSGFAFFRGGVSPTFNTFGSHPGVSRPGFLGKRNVRKVRFILPVMLPLHCLI